MTPSDRTDTDAVFEQGPRFPLGLLYPWVLGAGFLGFQLVIGEPMDARTWGAILVVCGGLFAVLAVAVLPQAMRSIRVDHRGLHVRGDLELAARRIGQVVALDGRRAAAVSWPMTRRIGTRLRSRQNLYGGALGSGPAVGIEEIDHRGARTSSWLIATRDPHALVAALEQARDHARRSRP